MVGVTNVWTFALGAVLIILMPGPNSLYVLTTASRYGIRAGYRGACGVFLGDIVLMSLSAAGVASLIRAQPLALTVVKYAGAGYLAFIGLRMVLIFFGTLLAAQFHRRRKLAAGVTTGAGTLFMGFGAKLATASLG
jgi:threonine/homoserine/homoserine lactone efflux protein